MSFFFFFFVIVFIFRFIVSILRGPCIIHAYTGDIYTPRPEVYRTEVYITFYERTTFDCNIPSRNKPT